MLFQSMTTGRGSGIIPFGEMKKQAQEGQDVWFRAAPSAVCIPVPVDELLVPGPQEISTEIQKSGVSIEKLL